MLYPEESLGTIAPGWRAASVVFFVDKTTQDVLLGQHTRGPFIGQWTGLGGKFEEMSDGDMRDCTIRESAQESGIDEGVLSKTRLSLVGVLVCFNTDSHNRRVPVYTYTVHDKEELAFVQGADGMDNLGWYAHHALPSPLKGGVQELVTHITSGSQAHLFLKIHNTMHESVLYPERIMPLAREEYHDIYKTIMQIDL